MIADRYDVLRPLGQGTFGRTLLARDTMTGHTVALKVLNGRGTDWKSYELFEREAAVLRGLRHHGIPEVYQAIKAEYEGAPASILVMEYVEGTSLAEIIASKRPLESTEVVHIMVELLGILEYLHGRVPPVLHRDIKPANIVLRSSGTPALVDFGSVRHIHLGPEESGSTVAGTYGYMPYEQYMGQASPASDLYALGATLLHLLTGRAPREFMSEEGRIQVPAGLPGDPRLHSILSRLLRPSPAERFAGAREVRTALLSPAGMVPAATPRGPLSRDVVALVPLPPEPRIIEGDIAATLTRIAPTGWDLMDSSSKRRDRVGPMDLLSVVFFGIITAGVLPIVFFRMASQRRKHLRMFLEQGTSTWAVILGLQVETVAFEQKMTRVNYEFEVEGQLKRDSDQVMPVIANKWTVGDRVQILYIAERDFDSVIIST